MNILEKAKTYLSSSLFTIAHIRAKSDVSWFVAIKEYLWNEIHIRKMKKESDACKQHLLRDMKTIGGDDV